MLFIDDPSIFKIYSRKTFDTIIVACEKVHCHAEFHSDRHFLFFLICGFLKFEHGMSRKNISILGFGNAFFRAIILFLIFSCNLKFNLDCKCALGSSKLLIL